MSYARPTGREDGPPEGLDRLGRFRWWIDWRLARSAENNATSAFADTRGYFIEHPSKPCTSCTHGDVFEHRTGQRRTCPVCRGLMRIPMSTAEIREEYRTIRFRVVGESYGGITICEDDFDAEARKLVELGSRVTPGHWLAAAREIEKTKVREREERRREVRSRW